MSAGISAIATLSPIMASQFIFSSRRLDRGLEALQSDPMTAVMNFDIATAQCAKGSKAALDVAKTTSAEMKQVAQGISNTAKEVANSSKILKGVSTAKYKQFVQNCFDLCPRQALHAKTLGFTHPVTGEQLHFNSELPQDMQSLIEKWRNYSREKF